MDALPRQMSHSSGYLKSVRYGLGVQVLFPRHRFPIPSNSTGLEGDDSRQYVTEKAGSRGSPPFLSFQYITSSKPTEGRKLDGASFKHLADCLHRQEELFAVVIERDESEMLIESYCPCIFCFDSNSENAHDAREVEGASKGIEQQGLADAPSCMLVRDGKPPEKCGRNIIGLGDFSLLGVAQDGPGKSVSGKCVEPNDFRCWLAIHVTPRKVASHFLCGSFANVSIKGWLPA